MMKLKTIILVSTPNQITGLNLMMKVLKSLKDFKRRVQFIAAHGELTSIYDTYIEKRNDIAKSMVQSYCDEQNELNKKTKDWKVLNTENTQEIPADLQPEFFKKISKIEDEEIKITKKIKFTWEEIEKANCDFDEIILLKDFIIDYKKHS